MGVSFLFPIIKSNFHFTKFQISEGIFLMDISNSKNWLNAGLKEIENVGVLLTSEIENSHIGGTSDVETSLDLFLLYCFLKTKCSYNLNRMYEVEIKNGKLKLTSNKSIEPFERYGWVLIPYYSWGRNLLTSDLFEDIKKGKKYFKNYSSLLLAQLHPKRESPLGVAMDTFVAAFDSQGRDETKYIMIVTALEALFTISSSELSFRLASNIAWFLHPKFRAHRNRRKKFEEVKRLYNLRSRIIHGEYQEVKFEDFHAILGLFSTVIQKIVEVYNLPKIFLDKRKHKEFIRKLEVGYLDN